jgi:hypothetical protein
LHKVDLAQLEGRSIGKRSKQARVGKNGAVAGCVIEAKKAGASRIKRLRPLDKAVEFNRQIAGAPMRDMIDWIIGTNETVLDVAIDGLIAIVGASFLTGVLHVVIEAL